MHERTPHFALGGLLRMEDPGSRVVLYKQRVVYSIDNTLSIRELTVVIRTIAGHPIPIA